MYKDPAFGPVAEVVDSRPCPHCAESIKTAAKICRFCGKEVPPIVPLSDDYAKSFKTKSTAVPTMLISIVVLSVASVVIIYMLSGSRDALGIYEYRKRLQLLLKDPSSAEYQNDYVKNRINNHAAYCGWVNAKNSFGAYSGFSRFVVPNDSAPMIENTLASEAEVDSFRRQWIVHCQ